MIWLFLVGCMFTSTESIPVDSACQCSDVTLQDDQAGGIGRCESKVDGKFWCYVSTEAECSDKMESSRQAGLFWSHIACSTKDDTRDASTRNSECVTVGGDDTGATCVFPFIYQGKSYDGCTLENADDGIPWCSTQVDSQGVHVGKQGKWGHCGPWCPTVSGSDITPEDSLCECSDVTLQDDIDGEIGRCESKLGGKFWCYVSSNSGCSDKKESSRQSRLFWSHKACGTKSANINRTDTTRGGETRNSGCVTVGGDDTGATCVFPFIHQGKSYNGCTLDEADDRIPWCSTKVDSQGVHVGNQGKWGHCGQGCPTDLGGVILPACECSDVTVQDDKGGQIGGCGTTLQGKFWCYVSSSSECSDKKESSRQAGLFWSHRACGTKSSTRNTAVEWCTGDYYENGRPPAGTKCVEIYNNICYNQSGRWGTSWCSTNLGTWGAECVKCSESDSCTGSSSDWDCCTPSSPCGEKHGDCDNDSDCDGDLVCGLDNCRDFHPLAKSLADCCIKPEDKDSCTGSSSDWKCCTPSSPCGEEQGDCDTDSDCDGDLVCGKDNCRDFHDLAHRAADCCITGGGNTAPMPNIGYLFRGYDIMKGNPFDDNVDPGFRLPIFKAEYKSRKVTPDRRYLQPDGFSTQDCSGSCAISFESTEISGAKSYQKSIEHIVTTSGGYSYGAFSASFSASASFKKVQQRTEFHSDVFTVSTATCCSYLAQTLTHRPPPLSSNFRSALAQLPSNYNEGAYYKFIETFGTHFLREAQMGALFGQESQISSKAWTTAKTQGRDISAEASFSAYGATGSAGYQNIEEKKKAEDFKKTTTKQDIFTKGSPPPADGKAVTWAREAKSAPVPMILKLASIMEIFDFSTIQVSSAVKANIKKAMDNYCGNLRQRGVVKTCSSPSDIPFPSLPAVTEGTCFVDTEIRRLLKHQFDLKGTNSPQQCMATCAKLEYDYAGVQHSYQCFCGNDQPPISSIRHYSECNAICPGNSDRCGGNWRMNIFSTRGIRVSARASSSKESRTNCWDGLAWCRWDPGFAIDSIIQTSDRKIFHSNNEDYPWIEIELRKSVKVSKVSINPLWNRPIFRNAEIRAGMTRVPDGLTGQLLNINTVCGTYQGPAASAESIGIVCERPILAKFVTIQQKVMGDPLVISEVDIVNLLF